jgi:methionyl-tRNA formyltransferase
MKRRQVVLLGKGTLAVRAAEWLAESPDHELVAIVPVVPEPTWTVSLIDWAKRHGVEYVESGHYRDLPRLEDGEHIQLAVSIFYDKIIEAWFIDRCERIINLHNGPLPRYRGVSPINWALTNGERKHGVTIHEITPGIDDGPIVSQVEYSIYPETDEVIEVYERALEFGWTLFTQTMPILDRIEAAPQDHERATYYSARDNDQLGERSGFTRAESARARA